MGGPDFLAGLRVERDQHGFTCGEVDLVAIESDAAAGIVRDDGSRRTRPFVSPEKIAGADIDRDHLVVRRGDEHDAVVDQRARIRGLWFLRSRKSRPGCRLLTLAVVIWSSGL